VKILTKKILTISLAILIIAGTITIFIHKNELTVANDPSYIAQQFLESVISQDFKSASEHTQEGTTIDIINRFREVIVSMVGEENVTKYRVVGIENIDTVMKVNYLDDQGKVIPYDKAVELSEEKAEKSQEYQEIVTQYGNIMKKFADTVLKNHEKVDLETEKLGNLGFQKLAELNQKFMKIVEKYKTIGYNVNISFPGGRESSNSITIVLPMRFDENGRLLILVPGLE